MTNCKGQLRKMSVLETNPIEYYFYLVGDDLERIEPILVNKYLGKELTLRYTGNIECVGCKRNIKKTYQQGYCFPCTQKLAACDMCILKPQLCHFTAGTCREPEWGVQNCNIAHIVYLANSSGLKVGLTRETQIPTRWIDQGAVQALPILRVKTRQQAGLIEVEIARLISDRTDWRKMLRGAGEPINLKAKRDYVFGELAAKIQQIAGNFKFGDIEFLTSEDVREFNYPVLEYPEKISTLDFDKTPVISGTLQGIKGQYLIFEHGVINMRKYTGYELVIE